MDKLESGRRGLTGALEAQAAEVQEWKSAILDAAMAKMPGGGSDTMRKEYEAGMMDLIGKKDKEAQMEPANPNFAVDGDWREIVIGNAVAQVRNLLGLDADSSVAATIEKFVRHHLA